MRIKALCVGLICVSSLAAAQVVTTQRVIVPKKLPNDLQSSFEERLSQFVAAQAEGHWDELGELLGRCGRECGGGTFYQSYTDSYKKCLVERIQEVRMLDFDFSIQDLSTSVPYGGWDPIGGLVDRFTAEQSSWYLKGTGRFQTPLESWMEETRVIAYRDQGQWYFIPPQRWMQDKWEKAHYTDADFIRDRRDEIEVLNSPSSPVEIADVHAYMNREYPAHRDLTFKIRNRTSKKITALVVEFHVKNAPGEESLGEGPIEPKGQITEQDAGFSAYDDFCEGTFKQIMFIEHVYFADGSKWELKPVAIQ